MAVYNDAMCKLGICEQIARASDPGVRGSEAQATMFALSLHQHNVAVCDVVAGLVLRLVGRGRVRAGRRAGAHPAAHQRHEPAAHQQGREHA